MKITRWLDAFGQDLRYAFRSLQASPAFTAVAVLTLAIGIGATTAIFSAVNATLLRPLPFPHPEQLINVRSRLTDGRVTSGFLSPVNIWALKNPRIPITGIAGVSNNPFEATLLRNDGRPVQVLLSGVTQGFFKILNLPLALGRGFTADDFVPSGQNAPEALIVSYRVWTEMFGRDPAIVGKTLRIVEIAGSITIAGVASPEMDFPHGTDFWWALRIDPHGIGHGLAGIVRLRPGTRIEALRSAAGAAMADLARTSPTDAGREYLMTPLLDSIVGSLGPTLLIVLAATALLLLLACVNVTDLLLARGAARTRELAMRAALGASRGRLIRQLLTEALVLAFAGAIFGLGLAYAGIRLLLVLGASKLPRLTTVAFDRRVFLFAIAVLVFSALAMGLAPALRLARANMRSLLNASGRSSTPGRSASGSMSALIVAEVAFAIVLAAGAGWLVESFARLHAVDPGFTTTGRLVVDVKVAKRLSPAEAHTWWDAMLEGVRAVPGVEWAGSGNTFPLRADRDGTLEVGVQGEVVDPEHEVGTHARGVTRDFFKAMGIHLLAGRDFTADDRQGTRPVAIVNEAFVRRLLGTRNPLATQFAMGLPQPDYRTVYTIVGVVQDVRYASLAGVPEPTCYLAEEQSPFLFLQQPVVVAARAGDPGALISGVQAELTKFDPQIVLNFETAPQIVAETLTNQRLGMTLMVIFGALALVLAAIGIYGIIAYSCAQRRTELATRIALGASAGQVFWLVMKSGQRLALIGIVIGVAGAYAGGRIVAGNFYQMRASDPAILLGATIIVGVVTFLATTIPAISSSRLDPARALRAD